VIIAQVSKQNSLFSNENKDAVFTQAFFWTLYYPFHAIFVYHQL